MTTNIDTYTTNIETVATNIVDAAVNIHKILGPGLLESAYQACLAFDLRKRGFHVECEVMLPITYGEYKVDAGYRIDMIVNDLILIENKCVGRILPIHEAQLLTYLRLGHYQIGFLLNWYVKYMKDGIKRMRV